MKALHLSIMVILITVAILIILSSQNVIAMPNISPQDLYKQSYMVFYGQVISKQTGPGPDYYYYQIKVETYFKNPQNTDSITVAGYKPGDARTGYPQFEVGDRAIFYINKLEGINTISSYSTKAGEGCDLHAFLGPSPIPGEPLIRGWPAEYPFFLRDENGNVVGGITTKHKIVLTYELGNNHPEWKSFALEMLLQRDIDAQPVFYKKQNVEMQPCSNLNVVQSSNTLTEGGNYTAKSILDGKVTSEISFEVKDSTSANTNSQFIASPLNQFKSGITANEIQCKEGLQLVIKSSNGFPACVKPSSISRLVEIGWGAKTIKVQNTDFAISYSITEGELASATANFDTHSLVISVQRTSNGDLTVKLPRGLIDSVNNGRDEVFTVLVNGDKVDYKEQKTQNYRTLTFQLKSGTTQVQIIPYCPPMGCGR